MKYDPYRNLAVAVVGFAVRDYKKDVRRRKAIRDWVNSEDFELYAGDLFTRSQVLDILDKEDERWQQLRK